MHIAIKARSRRSRGVSSACTGAGPTAPGSRLDHEAPAFGRLDHIDERQLKAARKLLQLIACRARKDSHPSGAISLSKAVLKVIHIRHPIVTKLV